MKIKYNSEIIAGSLFVIVSLVLWFLLPGQIQTMEKSAVSAQTVPKIAVGGIFLFSTALLLQGFLFIPKKEIIINKASLKGGELNNAYRALLFSAILLIYIVLLTFIGFVISSIMLVVSILLFYRAKKIYYYVIACGAVLIVYYVFTNLLNVSLP